jgi:hypothetical protein
VSVIGVGRRRRIRRSDRLRHRDRLVLAVVARRRRDPQLVDRRLRR